MSAEEFKTKGNAAFQAGKNEEAVNWFTSAINLDPTNHILYSNRSAAFCASKLYSKALEDATKVVELKPDWAKGWSRKGAALHGKGDYKAAVEAYSKGLELEPNNEACKKGLEEAKALQENMSNPFGKIFGPDVWVKIRMNPKLAPFLDDEDYVNKIKLIQANPQNMNMLLQDKRIMQTMAVLMGIDMHMAEDMEEDAPHTKKPEDKPKHTTASTSSSSTATSLAGTTKQAEEEKEKGNTFYKSKDFDKALECYNKAIELNPENVVYLINKAAVFFETQKYEECIQTCDEAIEKGKTYKTDTKNLAKAFARKGSALQKLEKYDDAITAFKSSLMEHRVADTLTKLNACETEKKEKEAVEYLDDAKAAEAKERGNEKFKAADYPAAVREYGEAIKRKPSDATYYSNRAAAYIKLNDHQRALKDCDKALELDPNYVKAVTRKAQIYYWQREYHKALEWYEKGLKLDPSNEELKSGVEYTLQKISEGQSSGEVDEDRVRRAMSDPEIQSIVQDPVMQSVLRDFSENPKQAQQHLKNPSVMGKLQKLIAAGIVRTSTRSTD